MTDIKLVVRKPRSDDFDLADVIYFQQNKLGKNVGIHALIGREGHYASGEEFLFFDRNGIQLDNSTWPKDDTVMITLKANWDRAKWVNPSVEGYESRRDARVKTSVTWEGPVEITRTMETGILKAASVQSRPRREKTRTRSIKSTRSTRNTRSTGSKSTRSARRSRTRGWAKSAPRRGRERHEMTKKCGSACFLDPKREKFPICAKLTRGASRCQIDCRGVQAAKNRAAQYGYDSIYKAADKILRKQCNRK